MPFQGTPSTRVRVIDPRYTVSEMRSQTLANNGSVSVDSGWVTTTLKTGGSQYTESVGHPFLSSKKKGLTDLGGEFFTQKKSVRYGDVVTFDHTWRTSPSSRSRRCYNGLCLAVNPAGGGSIKPGIDPYTNDVEIDALGATAVAATIPTNPVANVLVALAELRKDGLPHLPNLSNWEETAAIAQNAGDDYLNAQFGWVPLLSDIQDFISGVVSAPAVIEQYKAGIGKPTRRTYHFPDVSEEYEERIGSVGSALPYMANVTAFYGGGTLYRKTKVKRHRWFSGCFSYYFPDKILGSEGLADLAILGEQLGLNPSPEVLWKVAPWSWATDWFTNIGDVIHNYSAFLEDGLVMRYGYMMEHSIIESTYTLVNPRWTIPSGAIPVSDVVFSLETKTRRKANPYGFGVGWEGLSAFQLSILAALGITRV